MTTAQETYQAMVREQIAPRLRALGFRGSGSVYRLPDHAAWRLLGFQRSVSSNPQRVKFTINLTLADKAAWRAALPTHPWIGPRPTGNVGEYVAPPEVVEVARVGSLMPSETTSGGTFARRDLPSHSPTRSWTQSRGMRCRGFGGRSGPDRASTICSGMDDSS